MAVSGDEERPRADTAAFGGGVGKRPDVAGLVDLVDVSGEGDSYLQLVFGAHDAARACRDQKTYHLAVVHPPILHEHVCAINSGPTDLVVRPLTSALDWEAGSPPRHLIQPNNPKVDTLPDVIGRPGRKSPASQRPAVTEWRS